MREKEQRKNSTITDQKTLSPTDQLARDIYTTVTVLQQSGQLTEETTAALVNQITASIEESVQIKQYTQNDLVIVPTTDQSRFAYQNLLVRTLAPISAADMNAVTESLAVTDPADVNPEIISGILKKYETINSNLLTMKVPGESIAKHLDLLNTMEVLYSNLNGIAHGKEDPMKGVVAVTQLQQTLQKLVEVTK